METPSSTRRITRSQAKAAASASANSNILLLSKKSEESERGLTNSRQMSAKKQPKNQDQERSALVDITNDSPIVGLAIGSLETPSSAMSKKRIISQGKCARTPGSGEALLRGQVKTLLQKVEEEAELSKITFEDRPFFNLHGIICSPMNLIAPTPANTPQVLNFSDGNDFPPLTSSPVSEKFLIPQMMNEMFGEKKEDENFITRSLMLDFSEKLERSDLSDSSSALSSEGVLKQGTESGKERESTDDDASSIWSIQVNVSSPINGDEEEEEEEEEEVGENSVDEYDPYDEEEKEGEGGFSVDELCEGISKISVEEERLPKFSGKHIRFLYDSDDELQLQGEEQDECESCNCNAVRLKGLPTPKGKHLRFREEE